MKICELKTKKSADPDSPLLLTLSMNLCLSVYVCTYIYICVCDVCWCFCVSLFFHFCFAEKTGAEGGLKKKGKRVKREKVCGGQRSLRSEKEKGLSAKIVETKEGSLPFYDLFSLYVGEEGQGQRERERETGMVCFLYLLIS